MPYESETTHYSVVDQWGNAVSVTTTLSISALVQESAFQELGFY